MMSRTNIVEPDHRGVKQVIRPLLGCKSFEATQDTLARMELRQMLRKEPMNGGAEHGLTAAAPFYALAASFLPQQDFLSPPSKVATEPHRGGTCLKVRSDMAQFPTKRCHTSRGETDAAQ